ncbi:uncharacterized protein LOC111629683 [Centruroides sculpturatus]|uniref:uncharacterized protein LOC111629683 n=1 Tax=Centruroides sculpturatus TaxID=218467 RepID=UPI000C6DC991|nr:uncharacterized protein LOC111629683 [Centruroides sculpturatus]
MSNVEEQEKFDIDKVTIVNDNGESVVVSRTLLIEKGGLLKHFITICPNEGKFILRLPLPLELLEEFTRFPEDEKFPIPSVNNLFRMYLFCKQYFMSELEKRYFYYLIVLLYFNNVCSIYDLACRHNETQLQYRCWKYFSLCNKSIFLTDDFQSCEETTVYRLLTCPVHKQLKEVDLFFALRRWIEKRVLKMKATNDNVWKRDVIKPFLPLIRFFLIEPEVLKQILNNCLKVQILTVEEIHSITEYIAHKNVANLPVIISANVKLRSFSNYFSFMGKYPVTKEILKSDIPMKEHFQFMTDIWVSEKCFLDDILLPMALNKCVIKVLVGMKSTYSDDFVYEQCTCVRMGIIHLEKGKLLPKNSFHIFSVKIPKRELDSTTIKVLKNARVYVPIYDFRDANTRSRDEKTKFSCILSLCF